MKHALLVVIAMVGVTTHGAAQSVVPLPGAVPANIGVEDAGATANGKRIYFTSDKGDIWFYNRLTATSEKIGHLTDSWDFTVAPNGQAVAFTKSGEKGSDEYVWTIPLDVRTGMPMGPERRVTVTQGNTPAISPDGRWVAFQRDDSTGALTIAPLNGGPERIVTTMPERGSAIELIRWSPDGKAIYYGLNPRRDQRDHLPAILRVPAAGGSPTLIAHVGQAWPLLSPNGKLLVSGDTGVTLRRVVHDASGKRVATVDVPASMPFTMGWADDAHLLIATSSTVRQLRAYSMADGRSRLLIDGVPHLQQPSISPDGKQVSIVQSIARRSQLLVANIDGTNRRTLPLSKQWGTGNKWSPDSRWIAYHGASGGYWAGLTALNATTGREVELAADAPFAPGYYPIEWLSDSRRALFIAQGDSAPGASPTRDYLIREGTLGQMPVTRRTLTMPYDGIVSPLGDTAMITHSAPTAATLFTTIRQGGPETTLLPASFGFVAIPTISSDGRWVAFRRNTAQNNNRHLTVLDVMQLDGTHRTTMTLPFSMAPGGDNPHFLPGAKQLILAEDASQSDSAGVYLVNLADRSFKKLFTLPHESNNRGTQFAVTPDGQTILYLTTERVPVTFALLSVPSTNR